MQLHEQSKENIIVGDSLIKDRHIMADEGVEASSGATPRLFYGYVVVLTALCIMFVGMGARFAFGVFFKPLLSEFGWTRAMTSSAFSLSMAVEGVAAIIMGGLCDKFGPRIILTICGLLLGLGYLLVSKITGIWQLYLFYGVIIGVGMSGFYIPLLSTVARWFTQRRSMMTGIVLSGTGLGALVAPPLAERLVSAYDWRISYIIIGSIVTVIVVLGAQFLRRDPTQMGQVPYGENSNRDKGLGLAIEGFSLREAVNTRQFWLFFGMLLGYGFCVFAVMVHIVPHATDLGTSEASAASILATIGGLTIVGRLVLGSAADRIGNRKALIIGFILMSLSLFWLVTAKELWMLYLSAVVFGLANGGIAPSASPLVAGLFGLRSHGLIYGFGGLGFTAGATVGPLLTGYIFDVTGSYQSAFLTCGLIGIAGLILTVFLTPTRGQRGW